MWYDIHGSGFVGLGAVVDFVAQHAAPEPERFPQKHPQGHFHSFLRTDHLVVTQSEGDKGDGPHFQLESVARYHEFVRLFHGRFLRREIHGTDFRFGHTRPTGRCFLFLLHLVDGRYIGSVQQAEIQSAFHGAARAGFSGATKTRFGHPLRHTQTGKTLHLHFTVRGICLRFPIHQRGDCGDEIKQIFALFYL